MPTSKHRRRVYQEDPQGRAQRRKGAVSGAGGVGGGWLVASGFQQAKEHSKTAGSKLGNRFIMLKPSSATRLGAGLAALGASGALYRRAGKPHERWT